MKFTRIAAVAWALVLAAPAGEAPRAGEEGLVKSEFIYETAPFPQCHASTIEEVSRDELVAAWFGGTRERHPDVGIWLSRSTGGRWSPPVEVANGIQTGGTNRFPCWNPVLFKPRKGELWLFYKVGPTPSTWWGMIMTSHDGGKTWSDPKRLPDGIPGPIKNKPVRADDGGILCPSSTEDGGWRVHFERGKDDGLTWTASSPVENWGLIDAIQPSILKHRDGKLQAIGRTRQGWLFESWSEDQGRTWSALHLMNLPNPNSGIDAVTLRDGWHLLVYNHTQKGRSPLNVAVSKDGENWLAALVLENEPKAEFSYPAVIQTSDGRVHITYTWKRERIRHVVIDPRKLRLRPIVQNEE